MNISKPHDLENARFNLPARSSDSVGNSQQNLALRADARPLYDEANELVGIFITSVRRLRASQTFAKVIVSLFVVFLVLTFLF